jgi:hypothetical protein
MKQETLSLSELSFGAPLLSILGAKFARPLIQFILIAL